MDKLNVVLFVGTLGLGGAEKQLVYMARALQQSGVRVSIFCLTKDEYYESILKEFKLPPVWIGENPNPIRRLIKLIGELRKIKPHIIQSTHFYTNLYAALVAPLFNALAIGSLRSDAINAVMMNGFWGKLLLKIPQAIITNSKNAKQNAVTLGAKERKLFTLPNVIDLEMFDREYALSSKIKLPFQKTGSQINIVTVGNLVPAKRIDRFLYAIQKARSINPTIHGFIIGEGEEREKLQNLAAKLDLFPDGVHFIGRSNQVPQLLGQSDIFVLSSDNEGMPNVILEAMAARLPVITTPAGDAAIAVEHEVTGLVVPFGDIDLLASTMVKLSTSPELCKKLGEAGRIRVEQYYSYDMLGGRLLSIYKDIAIKNKNIRVLDAIIKQIND